MVKKGQFLTKFGLGNFLSYKEQAPVDLGQLNIFIGKNSSGKSTVLHALALLSETLLDASAHTSMLFSGNGLNLGTYPDVVYRNKRKTSFWFDLSTDPPDEAGDRKPNDHILSRARFTFREDTKSFRPYISAVAMYTEGAARCFTLQGYVTGKAPGYVPAEVTAFKQKPAGLVPRFDHFLPFFYRESGIGPHGPFLEANNYSWALQRIFRELVYIGPSRSPIDAIYIPSGRFPDRLDSSGKNTVPFILGLIRKERDWEKFNAVLQLWLGSRLGLVSNSTLAGFSGGWGHRLEGTDPLVRATVSLSNTGYGVSQILPILVQLALGSPCVLLVEQPEIHLHPDAQAELADLLLVFVEKGYQLFVETHSEHLILRLRALLAKKKTKVAARDVKLFHVEKTKEGSSLHPVEVSDTGDVTGWPKGFFSASANDLATLLETKARAK